MKKNLLLVVILVSVLLSALYFLLRSNSFYPAFLGCNVSIVSNSKIVSVKVVNKKLFKSFAESLLHCKKGYFKVGHPYEGTGPFFVKSVQIIIDDNKYQNVTYDGKNTDGSLGAELNNFDFDFIKGKAIIRISFTSDFVNKSDFRDRIAFDLASRIDSLYKYNDFRERIERNYKNANTSYLSKGIGLEIHVK